MNGLRIAAAIVGGSLREGLTTDAYQPLRKSGRTRAIGRSRHRTRGP
jgi:hypothetical protein